MLRTVVWSDLMKTGLIDIEEKKHLVQYQTKFYQKDLSTFEHFVEFQQKYDSVAFRQIDEDIRDFKFPAHYFEETIDQNQQDTVKMFNNMPQKSGTINRINKLKHDKQ
jgi:hypothetical protein